MNYKFLGRAAALLLAATLATPVLADTVGGAVVHTNDTGLNLREEATTFSTALETIPNGAFLLVEETLDGWYKVAYNGKTGYVSADYAEFAIALDGDYDFAAATLGSDVNLRFGADLSAGLVKSFPMTGSDLTVTGVSGKWLKVLDGSGDSGYIRSDLVTYTAAPETSEALEETGAATPAAATGTLGEEVAASARAYLGYSYRWGGMSPETGFDCSGFANYIYGLYGYSLERVAQNIYSSNGVLVRWSDLLPGDLLFFGSGPSCVTHVGIYVGDGQMVHASTSATGVILSNVADSAYYARMYVGAKRIIN